ncbi:MAG: translocation/assembly module TamB domain-containing protein [Tatlockia sp.]|nr:translocation/assembly module TamB domain-containing protein [Tatlockia sp.]
MKAIQSIVYKLVFLLVLLTSIFIFLVSTSTGLVIISKLAQISIPGEFYIEEPKGRLISNFSMAKLRYKNKNIELSLSNLTMRWRWKSLIQNQLLIEKLSASSMELSTIQEKNINQPSFKLPKLPVELNLQNLTIGQIILKKNSSIWSFERFSMHAFFSNQLWQIYQSKLSLADNHFNLEGKIQPSYPYASTAKLTFNLNHQGQSIDGFLTAGGELSLYHWHAEATKPSNFILNGTLRNVVELNSFANWANFVWPINKDLLLKSPEGSLQIKGNFPNFTLQLLTKTTAPLESAIQLNATTTHEGFTSSSEVKIPKGYLRINLASNELKLPKIQGEIEAKSFDLLGINFPLQELNINSQFSGNSVQNLVVNADLNALYFGSHLEGFISYQNQEAKAELRLGKNEVLLSGSPPYQWQLKATIPEPKLLHPALKSLETTVSAEAVLTTPNSGHATINLAPGSYHIAEGKPQRRLEFLGGEVKADLSQQSLQVNGHLTIDPNKSLAVELALPKFELTKGLGESQTVTGKLNLKVNSLNFIQTLSPALSKIEGELNANLLVSGTVKQPAYEGYLSLDKARILMTQLGLDLNPVQFNLLSRNKTWTLEGSMKSQNQPLNLKGKGEFAPKLNGSILVEASNFPLIKTSEYSINISPQLILTLTPNLVDIKGTILVPTAQIKPQSFDNTVNLSPDVIFKNAKPVEESNSLPINADIRVEMGSEVAINVKGLQGFLQGSLQLRKVPQSSLKAIGELTVRDGTYKAYGQDLTIDQGELLFTGGIIDNPNINVRASRHFNSSSSLAKTSQMLDFKSANLQTLDIGENTTAGVQVTGPLKSPKISLFSEPSTLSQADILSLLILGKPASQANKAGGQLLLKAITSMNLGSDSRGLQLIEQLKQTLDLDVDLKTNTSVNKQTNKLSDSNSIVVGKSLTKRIYLSYNYDLADKTAQDSDPSTFTITYLLNKFFSIQVNANVDTSSIDLLYTHKQRDNSK